jgi:dienelactone hydrolase
MDKAGVDYSFTNYPGAKHSFTNPGADEYGKEFNMPLAYNKEADEKSWNALLQELMQLYHP